ncbi:MAG: pectate lyase [Lewinellaceae bacterium]|nr:pectate lyase [Lewinellaceae bacterium]
MKSNHFPSVLFIFLLCSSTAIPAVAQNEPQAAENKQSQLAELGRSLRWWDQNASRKPYSWYRSEQGLRMAENILSWQDNGTGWPLMSTVREPFTGDMSKAGPWGKKAALVKATLNELRFLSRGYTATEDERYLTAMLGGLNYILEAQLPCGGWPHSYPYRSSDYSHYATYNDDVIPDIMTFLDEVRRSPDFKAVGEENLRRAKAAYDKGLEFILRSQIVVDGKRTAWAQQYDEATIEPRPARAFEPAAISGGESASVLLFLMGISKPSPEVIEATAAGVQWYRDVQIDGLELVQTADDRMVRPNPDAPPLWARYYEIGSDKPIFAGRDGIIRYSLAEIEQERRRGYAWYNYNGTGVFKRYEAWRYERKWDSMPPTNTDEAKVAAYTLPDPLVMQNGEPVTSPSVWKEKRRPEILRLFEQYQYGRTPDTDIEVAYEVIEQAVPGMGGKSRRTQVRIRFPGHPAVTPIHVLLNVPADAKGPVPTLLHISFSPNVLLFDEPGIDEGFAWDRRLEIQIPGREARLLKDTKPEHFIDHGYGIATVYYGDIEPDLDNGWQYGVRALFGAQEERAPDGWGAIGAWSWGLSRVMDYLQTDPAVDGKKVALSGVSRLGKTVLWAAAQDERFALAIPIVSGEGGDAISRRNYGETIADLTNPARYDYWFAPRYAEYAPSPEALPVDAHMLLALIAPRPILQLVGSTDTWSDPRGEWLSAVAASPVYALFGLKGVDGAPEPKPGDRILHDMGFLMHDGGHTVLPEDYEMMTDFMDRHFGKAGGRE